MNSPGQRQPLYKGTLDLLILGVVAHQALHGWAIADRLKCLSRGLIDIPEGSLYPALHRLERQGLLRSEWQAGQRGRKARVYHLTRQGRRAREQEHSRWQSFCEAVSRVLADKPL